MVLLIAVCAAGAVLLGFYWVFAGMAERSAVRSSLRQLDGYQIQGLRDQEMLQPMSERVFAPALQGVLDFLTAKTPVGYTDGLRRKLALAGHPDNMDVERILLFKILGAISVVAWIPLVYGMLGLSGMLGLVGVGVLWYGSFQLPDIRLNRAVEDRKKDIGRKLPDVLDLLTISVEAGLGFDQALERTTAAVPGTLSDEFRRMLQETRIGASRADALRAVDERTQVPELRTFILAMLQADTFGVSIARILRTQSYDMRQRRRLKAQEMAQKAPVKMLFPLMFCIFPGVLVMVLYPAFKHIGSALS
ncbi:MAG: type II secretion system F family protein [Acidimicrobiia bacterium]